MSRIKALIRLRLHKLIGMHMFKSIYSEEGSNSFKRHSFSSDKPVYRFLIFDCDSTSSFLVAGKIVNTQSSLVLHIEQLSTDTIEDFLKAYLKRAAKEVKEFHGKDIADFSVTDDIGKRVDYNMKAIICLLFDEKQLMRDTNIGHSYPTFIVHLTPKPYSYIQLKVRIMGGDKGHMHPFTVFVRSDCSTVKLRQEISKHSHWNPKSFEVFLPNSPNVIDEVENIQNLPKLISVNSVLTVRRTKKNSLDN
ncbi:unnamed protein product [Mytilus coruscus]|uniref:Uncharacterized protein n=1 Tax=Mytilus coruscus TaxID=42192 RepID=A0A6J8BWF8_MYTCO|nr:unnamed protein product [Mytilus coruscus]